MMGMVVSVNVGLPRDVAWQGRTVRTGIWKQPVTGRIFARRLNLDGDGQGDLRGHGGEQRALMVYQLCSGGIRTIAIRRRSRAPGPFDHDLPRGQHSQPANSSTTKERSTL
jgi:MOSC domain-containing protein YiiM